MSMSCQALRDRVAGPRFDRGILGLLTGLPVDKSVRNPGSPRGISILFIVRCR